MSNLANGKMLRFATIACLAMACALGDRLAWGDERIALEYAPAPVDNPLKGLVPYQSDGPTFFPHSLEFNYLAYSALVKGYDEFDWRPLEKLLDDIASRGRQAVFRIYLEYPGKRGVIPAFLVADGLKVHRWRYTETQPLPPAPIETPDYEDKNLRSSLTSFIAALGAKYDGDPRIGFLTAGLLGVWGEWHDYPKEDLFASEAVQTEVMDAYEAALKITPVLLRYPAGDRTPGKATNAHRKFGYHDDSFAWATLHTGKQDDEWFYMTMLKAAGPAAEAKWKTHPIGGELRPEAWGLAFDEKPDKTEIQNFRQCVEETHVSWLMDSGMFEARQSAERIQRAEAAVRRMGYELHAPAVTIGRDKSGKLVVKLEVENRGVAPFYYDWQVEWGLLAGANVVQSWPASGKLTGLLPGDKPRFWSDTLDVSAVAAGKYSLAVRAPNPLKGGKLLRFANASQDAASGWLMLGDVEIP